MLLIAISRSLAQQGVNSELLMDGDASERSLKFAKSFLVCAHVGAVKR